MSSGSSDELEPPVDLASFEVLTFSNPADSDLSESVHQSESTKDKTKLKSRLLTAWNNMRYRGWSLKSKPRLSKTSDVYLLGHKYQLSHEGSRECFRRTFSSLFWLTYRKGFVPLDGSSLTSDCGWGCTLRSAQMLLAQGLLLHTMPPGWTWQGAQPKTKDDLEIRMALTLAWRHRLAQRRWSEGVVLNEDEQERAHRRLVAWFGDTPSSPFSLHRLVELGRASGKRAGDWYGPSVAAHILCKAVAASEVSDLAVYVAQDCTVYVGDVLSLYEDSRSVSTRCKSLILLVPVRLGGDALNPAYITCIKKLLELKCCIGIVGGKPRHSLYFVGFQDDQLLYLDPHFCQAAVDTRHPKFPLESFHCKTVRKLPFLRMDPSCTLGFYASSRQDFDRLRSELTTALSASTDTYPVFTFVEGGAQAEHSEGESAFDPVMPCDVPHKGKARRRSKQSSTEDFVLL